MRQPRNKGALPKLLALAVTLAFIGCQSGAPRRGVLHRKIHPEADVAVNTEQARLRVRVLVEPYCGSLESVADQIIASNTNNAIRREALVWKIEAVPAMCETLFHSNPFLALGDAWVLLWQMLEYFQNGAGRQAMGDSAPIAAAACASLEKQLTEVAASFTHSGDVTDVRTFVQKWAADHPIQHSITGRESVEGYFTKRRLQETFSAPEAAGDFVVTMDDLSRRIDVYNGRLMNQARWQAELFAMDLIGDNQVQNIMPLAAKAVQSIAVAADGADRAAGNLERTANALETAPQLIAKEREAVLQEIQAEVLRTIQFGQQERVSIFGELSKERVAALLELHRNIAEERSAFTRDLERIGLNLVDHAFLRSAELVAVLLLVMFAGAAVLLFLTRRLFVPKQTTV